MIKYPNIDPVIISFGELSITWYSLSYVVGILSGYFLTKRIITKFNLTITHKQAEDFISFAIIGIVVGGRLGYVLFYDPIKYLSNPIDILKTYEGGMSFHGGLIGYIISLYIFCKKEKINLLLFADIIAVVVPIGLFLGRIANFINGELYGRVTDFALAMRFPNSDMLPRHPSQLYEALLEGIVLFIIMLYSIYRKNSLQYRGRTSGIFLFFYSIFRILVENFREPDLHIGFILDYITMGQVLSLPIMLVGIYLIIRSKFNFINIKNEKK